jgi:hypothetical protein
VKISEIISQRRNAMNYYATWIFIAGIILLAVGLIRYFSRKRDGYEIPTCDRCNSCHDVEAIKMNDADTPHFICRECSRKATIEPKEFVWALTLSKLCELAKSIQDFNCVRRLSFWPKFNSQSLLSMEDIMKIVKGSESFGVCKRDFVLAASMDYLCDRCKENSKNSGALCDKCLGIISKAMNEDDAFEVNDRKFRHPSDSFYDFCSKQ